MFVDETLQRCRVSAGNCTLFNPPRGTEAVGAKGKNANRAQHWLHVKTSAGRFSVDVHVCKSPTETHVRCLFEEATRFICTKLKRFKHAAHRLEKQNVRAGGWVNTHNDFCKRMTGEGGVSVAMVSLWKRLIGCWLLLPQNNTVIHSTGRTLTVFFSVCPDVEFMYSHTTKSKR